MMVAKWKPIDTAKRDPNIPYVVGREHKSGLFDSWYFASWQPDGDYWENCDNSDPCVPTHWLCVVPSIDPMEKK